MSGETVSVLELRLHDQLVGYVAGHSNGRNVFTLAPQYIADPSRQRLDPVLGNLRSIEPDAPAQQAVLRDHWRRLSTDFRIDG
ncbi:hypothetical protein SFA35_01895 [Pseudomonas sp. HR96]|uniref:hypothetical protein n=1 Tax=Pseudomonas sp. HR96 TaxID=1027966 RepID=UPI002A75F85C|nr:hypothetical protein [Pseudomonas sp. HR96]WPP00166.1 hypothetical protein SFA35_01895 [Pseudomonas sp. HR96]